MTGITTSVVLLIACMAYTTFGASITERKKNMKEATRDVLDKLREYRSIYREEPYLEDESHLDGFVTVNGVGVKLVGGRNERMGALMVAHGNETGWLCDDRFGHDKNGAKVVCWMLGYNDGQYEDGNKFTSKGSTPYILRDVACTGREDSIDNCGHMPWGVEYYCYDSQLAGVQCWSPRVL